MPSSDANSTADRTWTRRGLLAGSTVVLGTLTGCGSVTGPGGDAGDGPATPSGTTQTARQGSDSSARPDPLSVQLTSAVWEGVELAAGLWNANPSPTGDGLVWGRFGSRPEFDERLANRFAGGAGLSVTGGQADPPFGVVTQAGLPSVGIEAFADGRVDIGRIDDPERERDPDQATRADGVVSHPIGRDGWVFVVSPAVAEAGVDALTAEEIYRVYSGEISNWRDLGGPDAEPFVITGPHVDGYDPAYERFFDAGGVLPDFDARLGQERELVGLTHQRDDAISVLQASGVRRARERGVPTLDVVVDGNRQTPYDHGYPMTTSVSLHTLGDPDPRERAFLAMFTSSFGQRALVGRSLLPLRPVEGR